MGDSTATRLKKSGIEATKTDALRVPAVFLWFAPKGHPLFDPRSEYPPDKAMALDMVDRFERGASVLDHEIIVRDEGEDPETNVRRLHVNDGHQRTNALRLAATILRQRGKLGASEHLRAKIDMIACDDAGFIEERIRRNDHDRFTRKDSLDVLSLRVRQLTALGRDAKAIAAVCPAGVGASEVEALRDFDNLAAPLRRRFASGEVPLALLRAVLDMVPEHRAQGLDKLLAAGVRTKAGATRTANGERAKADPWALRMNPRTLLKVAERIHYAKPGKPDHHEALAWIAVGLRLATADARGVLEGLDPKLADAIREARAAK